MRSGAEQGRAGTSRLPLFPQRFQLRPQPRQRSVIGAESLQFCRGNLLGAQARVLGLQAPPFVVRAARVQQLGAQANRLAPLPRERRAETHQQQRGENEEAVGLRFHAPWRHRAGPRRAISFPSGTRSRMMLS